MQTPVQKYMVFIIQAYDGLDHNQITDVTTLELMENDGNTAIARAKKLIKKKNYRIASIVENYVRS